MPTITEAKGGCDTAIDIAFFGMTEFLSAGAIPIYISGNAVGRDLRGLPRVA